MSVVERVRLDFVFNNQVSVVSVINMNYSQEEIINVDYGLDIPHRK